MIETLDDAHKHQDRDGTRAAIILGFASIGAGLGAAMGGLTLIAMHPGYIPDYPPYSAAGVVAGAGSGWVLGALAGTAASRGGRAVRGGVATVLWIAAGVAIISAVVLWNYWESFLQTRILIEGELRPLQLATLASAVVVAVTLVGASLAAPRDGRDPPGLIARLLSVVGIIVLAALFAAILASIYFVQQDKLDQRTQRAKGTAARLLMNADAMRQKLGHFPATRRELIDGSGISRAPDVEVRHFGETADAFCVAVALVGQVRGSDADDIVVFGVIEEGASSGVTYVGDTDPCGLA